MSATSIARGGVVALILGGIVAPVTGGAFVASADRSYSRNGRWKASSCLRMGLYDEPLPDRPPPSGGGPFQRNVPSSQPSERLGDSDEFIRPEDMPLIFEMKDDGSEANGLLPSLRRRLDTGVDCYFERTDRKVQNLSEKAGCNPLDAAWALEAHKGDVTEAWTSISYARRNTLNSGAASPVEEEVKDTDWDAELKSLLDRGSGGSPKAKIVRPREQQKGDPENQPKEAKRKSAEESIKEAFFDFTEGTKWGPDDKYIPGKANPRPVDDEPWFTG